MFLDQVIFRIFVNFTIYGRGVHFLLGKGFQWKYLSRSFFPAIFVVLFACSPLYSAEKEADAVWIESDGVRHQVFYSTFTANSWSEPVQVTDDYFDNLHPVIDRDRQGKKWLFWTASDNGKLSLHFATSSDSVWSDAKDVPVELHSSIAPSMLIDSNDVLWLVWSGNTGGQDDIYFTTCTKGVWSSPQTVHPRDQVPDILPRISITDNNELAVTWKKYLQGSYHQVQSMWDGKKWSSFAEIEPVEQTMAEQLEKNQEIPIPAFVRDDERAFIRIY